jgi:hypothetical protein
MEPNDRGYGHLAVCGSITVAKRQSESGSKNLLNARQPANANRRVLCPWEMVFLRRDYYIFSRFAVSFVTFYVMLYLVSVVRF